MSRGALLRALVLSAAAALCEAKKKAAAPPAEVTGLAVLLSEPVLRWALGVSQSTPRGK